ncbi:MAG: hypothetical protein ACREOP_15800 [Thermodesulfobacteriota bacterium]
MAADPKFSHPKYLLVPVIAIFFILFSVSRDESGNIEFVNVPCSSAIVIAKDFGTSSLSTGTSAPEKQSILSLGQTAIFSKSSQFPVLNSDNPFSHNANIDFLRIHEEEVKYDLIISSNTNRSPPSNIS